MATTAIIPDETDFLEELDSYGCGLGIPNLIHAQAYFIRFVLQNKVALGYTDDFANELITGASYAIDIFASIDHRINTNLV